MPGVTQPFAARVRWTRAVGSHNSLHLHCDKLSVYQRDPRRSSEISAMIGESRDQAQNPCLTCVHSINELPVNYRPLFPWRT